MVVLDSSRIIDYSIVQILTDKMTVETRRGLKPMNRGNSEFNDTLYHLVHNWSRGIQLNPPKPREHYINLGTQNFNAQERIQFLMSMTFQ